MRSIGLAFLVAALCGAAAAQLAIAGGAEPPARIGASAGSPAGGDGIDRSALDLSVDACSDFYRHSCGGFIASAKLGENRPMVELAQQQFDSNLESDLSALFAQRATNDPELRRLETFFTSCRHADPAGTETVKTWLARIEAANGPGEIQKLIRDLSAIGVDMFFTYSGRPDRTDWKRYRGEIHNSILWADPAVVERTFTLAGLSPQAARRDAASATTITNALREHRGMRWDSKTAENARSLAELEKLAPSVEWRRYFLMVGAPMDRRVNITSPSYLAAVDRQLAERTPAELRAFIRWSFLFALRGELPTPYNQAFGDIPPNFRVALGDPSKRCREATVRAIGVEFSRQYSNRILGREARDSARRMAESIRQAFVKSVAENQWLSPEARRATADKLSKTHLLIGFPDRWPDVGTYKLYPDRFFDNALAARAFEQRREWKRAGKQRSLDDWEMKVDPWVGEGMAAARLVLPNGFPDAFSNSLIMTAAFLSPPRFDVSAAPELNYATFGAVFAHELTHVAQLHMFGPDGRDAELWTDADSKAAASRSACLIRQADSYEPLPGLKMPGEKQFAENVADYGGLRVAYEALEARMGPGLHRHDGGGATPEQRFFYRYAQYRCTAQTDESLRKSVQSDGHAPPEFRVNGPLSNLSAFGEAFGCKWGARMMRSKADQCQFW